MFSKILKHFFKLRTNRTFSQVRDESRKWRLLQIEPALACNLHCTMCPWVEYRKRRSDNGVMSEETWQSITPFLTDVQVIDFTGGGEPLLNPHLLKWFEQAKVAGCNTGFLTNGMLLTKEISEHLVKARIDWIGFSIDGADKQTYEGIRYGADFGRLTKNIRNFNAIRDQDKTLSMINFVIMKSNAHQLNGIVTLAEQLGIDQVNFKQCDVIRGTHGAGLGVFSPHQSKQAKAMSKQLQKARRQASSKNIATTAFRFLPEEHPVCDQDPRSALFIRYDGVIAPCINLAYGGQTEFLGSKAMMPEVHYGSLRSDTIEKLWDVELCRYYRDRFERRESSYASYLASNDMGRDLVSFNRSLDGARKAMGNAPQGCTTCHYLYGI